MSDTPETLGAKFTFTDFAILVMASALWIVVLSMVGSSHKVGPWVTLLALGGITVALQRLLRGLRHAWPLAAWIAPIVALGSLAAAGFFANR